MCRTLYVAKIASIGSTTSMVAVEIRVPSRGLRQTDVLMEKGKTMLTNILLGIIVLLLADIYYQIKRK